MQKVEGSSPFSRFAREPCKSIVGLFAEKANAHGAVWAWFQNVDINTLGFIIVAMFVATWAITLAVWHFGHIEERWSEHLVDGQVHA